MRLAPGIEAKDSCYVLQCCERLGPENLAHFMVMPLPLQWHLELGGLALSDTSSFGIYASKSPQQNASLIPDSNWELVGAPKWMYKPVFPLYYSQAPMLVGRVVMPQVRWSLLHLSLVVKAHLSSFRIFM